MECRDKCRAGQLCEHRGVCANRCPECRTENCSGLCRTAKPKTPLAWFYIIDAHGCFMYSVGAESITGYPDAELLGDTVYDMIIIPEDQPRIYTQREPIINGRLSFRHRHGHLIEISFTATPVIHKMTAALIGYQNTVVYQPALFEAKEG